MALMVTGISLPFTEPAEMALKVARQAVKGYTVRSAAVTKRAIDARKRSEIRFVYTVVLELDEDEIAAVECLARPDVHARPRYCLEIQRGSERLLHRPIVVGFGPAGMFAGLLLAQQGLRPLILERGADVDTRIAQVKAFWSTGALHEQSNVQFGEGGAGTFSDGKLVTRIGDARSAFVLEQFAVHGAPKEILWQAKPHVGTDQLRHVVKALRAEILRLGGEVLFDTRLESLGVQDGAIRTVRTTSGEFPARVVVLAPGHSARDLFAELQRIGVSLQPKPFSVGVRIEHLQSEIDRALYGDFAGHPLLPRGEYQLSYREGARAVYTFCMCPGGVVVPAASEIGMLVTNGMSEFARDGVNANSALVVSVDAADYGASALDGMEFQRRLETAAYLAGGGNYIAPAQTVGNFLNGKSGLSLSRVNPTYERGVAEADFSALFPDFVTDLLRTGLRRFERRLAGFAAPDAVLTGIESRTSSPLRILRGEDFQSVGLEGLYPCGEGAGYAGGIVSAAVDGVRVAQAILARYCA